MKRRKLEMSQNGNERKMFHEDDQVNLYNLVQVGTFLVGSFFFNMHYLKELHYR